MIFLGHARSHEMLSHSVETTHLNDAIKGVTAEPELTAVVEVCFRVC